MITNISNQLSSGKEVGEHAKSLAVGGAAVWVVLVKADRGASPIFFTGGDSVIDTTFGLLITTG